MRVQYKHTNCDDLYLSEAQEGNEKKEDEAEGGRDAGVLEEFRVTSSSGCGHVIAGCAEVFVTTEIITDLLIWIYLIFLIQIHRFMTAEKFIGKFGLGIRFKSIVNQIQINDLDMRSSFFSVFCGVAKLP